MNNKMYNKKYYPVIHFAPRFGWINDPNGLVFHDGVYELYFQHNPEGIEWGNMTWGHARSKDLLHWEEMEPVLHPDENGFMYSGCGVRNDRGALELPEDALIFFYTAALHDWQNASKTRFTIRLAYSLDGGDSLVKAGGPVLESLYPDNRDPKVFWHEESGAYIMVLWLQNNDFGIFRSEDLEHFNLSSQFLCCSVIFRDRPNHQYGMDLYKMYRASDDRRDEPAKNPVTGEKERQIFIEAEAS